MVHREPYTASVLITVARRLVFALVLHPGGFAVILVILDLQCRAREPPLCCPVRIHPSNCAAKFAR